jgi:hypothetical protein
MLKTRNLIFALSLCPLLLFGSQLQSHAQSSPSKGSAGSGSGSTNTSGPSKGTAGSGSGASKGTAGSVSGSINITIFRPISGSPNVTVSTGPDGVVNIRITPSAQRAVNQAAASVISNGLAAGTSTGSLIASLLGGGATGQSTAAQIESTLASRGVSSELARTLLGNLASLLSNLGTSITPSSPSAQLPQDQLLASVKGLKTSLMIAQNSTTQSVDVNKLSVAINAYNQIVQESSPVTLQALSQDQDFLAIGNALRELRKAID